MAQARLRSKEDPLEGPDNMASPIATQK